METDLGHLSVPRCRTLPHRVVHFAVLVNSQELVGPRDGVEIRTFPVVEVRVLHKFDKKFLIAFVISNLAPRTHRLPDFLQHVYVQPVEVIRSSCLCFERGH